MSIFAGLEEHALRPEHELACLMKQAPGAGGVVSFVGIARAASKDGEQVQRLELERHPTLTQQSLQDISTGAVDRFDVAAVRVVHRYGEVSAGEPIVFAGAAAAHRRVAFEAVDYLMDRLKTEAVLWKREVGEAGTQWIEPTDADYADRERWD